MLDKIIKKACNELSVLDTLGVRHSLKVLNFTTTGSRTSKLDRQCVTDANTTITEGLELNIPDGKVLIVSYKQADIYKDAVIRYTLDCIESSHRINISRTVTVKSKQGGLASQVDEVIYSNIPVKIGLSEVPESKTLDQNLPAYVMYLSHRYLLKIGDRINVSDATFEAAKVDSFVHVTPGLMEVRFDKDPRWL